MLANGITLGYKKSAAYEILKGLKEVPELGMEPEKIENTCLDDLSKKYEFGIGDPGDLEYTFKYDNNSATTSYRILRALADTRAMADFEQTYPDGTKMQFTAQVSLKLGGGSVNGVIDFKLKMALQSGFTIVDPVSKL